MIKNVSLKNLGTVNKNEVVIKSERGREIVLTFSYETIVGVNFDYRDYCHTNDWSNTTGKLLNELEPDKSKRLNDEDFTKKVNEAFDWLNDEIILEV